MNAEFDATNWQPFGWPLRRIAFILKLCVRRKERNMACGCVSVALSAQWQGRACRKCCAFSRLATLAGKLSSLFNEFLIIFIIYCAFHLFITCYIIFNLFFLCFSPMIAFSLSRQTRFSAVRLGYTCMVRACACALCVCVRAHVRV